MWYLYRIKQCCGSKYIEFGSGSRTRPNKDPDSELLKNLRKKINNNVRENNFL